MPDVLRKYGSYTGIELPLGADYEDYLNGKLSIAVYVDDPSFKEQRLLAVLKGGL